MSTTTPSAVTDAEVEALIRWLDKAGLDGIAIALRALLRDRQSRPAEVAAARADALREAADEVGKMAAECRNYGQTIRPEAMEKARNVVLSFIPTPPAGGASDA